MPHNAGVMRVWIHNLVIVITTWMAVAPVHAACCQQAEPVAMQAEQVMPCHGLEVADQQRGLADSAADLSPCSDQCQSLCHLSLFAVSVAPMAQARGEQPALQPTVQSILRPHRQSLLRPPSRLHS